METLVKGSSIHSIFNYLREVGLLESVLRKLEEPHRDHLTGVVSAGWYPVESFIQLLELIAQSPASKDRELFFKLGRRVVHDGLSGVYKALAKLVNPAVAIKRAPMLWGMYVQGCTLEVVNPAKGFVSGYLNDQPPMSRAMCKFVMGGFAEPIYLAGGSNVQVTHPQCQLDGHPRCYFEMRWDD